MDGDVGYRGISYCAASKLMARDRLARLFFPVVFETCRTGLEDGKTRRCEGRGGRWTIVAYHSSHNESGNASLLSSGNRDLTVAEIAVCPTLAKDLGGEITSLIERVVKMRIYDRVT